MSASKHARQERAELAELLLQVGPDSPTLCEGWTSRDLAAHLVVREGRPDAALGIVLSPLAAWTDRVTAAEASQPYPELVRKVRTGPPTLSVFSLPGAETLGNFVEYLVHHEDVRRAQPDWAPRDLPPDLADEVWKRVTMAARWMYRSIPVGVALVRTDGAGGRVVARKGEPMVTVSGGALEILLRMYGRRAVVLEIDGPSEAVEAFDAATMSL